jgi:hypothetical protein
MLIPETIDLVFAYPKIVIFHYLVSNTDIFLPHFLSKKCLLCNIIFIFTTKKDLISPIEKATNN